MKKAITLLAIFCISFGFSQRPIFVDLSAQAEPLFSNKLYHPPVAAIGTPYVNEEFSFAKINNSKELYLVRYNAHQDVMEVKKGENTEIIVLDNEKNYVISMNGKEYITTAFDNGERGIAHIVWEDTDHALFQKENVKFSPATKAKTSYEASTKAKYSEITNSYYVDFGNGSLVQVPKKKKKFYALFSDNTKNVQQFVKKEKLKIDNKEDLIKILNFYFS
ncbi:hypothetical protein D7030_02810 [Flavobacteriaceae bacterium AU392]|nr:hypothetical protein D1817_09285 [Flavobacteriaceae bacterium]RKM85620.1 hypothetical protein D7030_02810 [Flavobacteriaceae bacterium AU392]